jgi:hypothetical protein
MRVQEARDDLVAWLEAHVEPAFCPATGAAG